MTSLGSSVSVELLLASPFSRFVGRPGDGPLPATGPETHESVRIRAGLGVVGDRYFNAPAHRRASVTLLAAEAVEAVAQELRLGRALDPALARRNIVTRGLDVDALVGSTFSLDSGDGPVVFRANRPANPCAWMDEVLAPGAFRALRGRGGVRCEPLTDGVLRLGPVAVAFEGVGGAVATAVAVAGATAVAVDCASADAGVGSSADADVGGSA